MAGQMRRGGSGSNERTNVARVVALLLGVGYLAGGVIGFAETGFNTGFVANTNASLLGLDLNIFHNFVHVAIGATLILVSRIKDATITQGVLIGVGLFYVLAALLGYLNYLQIISINETLAADNFLHAITGGTALIFGLIGASQQDDPVHAGATPAGAMAGGGQRPIEERRAAWDTEETYREETY